MKILIDDNRTGLHNALRNLGHNVIPLTKTPFDAFDEFEPDAFVSFESPTRAMWKCLRERPHCKFLRTDCINIAAHDDLPKPAYNPAIDTDILFVGDYSLQTAKYILPLIGDRKVKIFGGGWNTPYCVGTAKELEEILQVLASTKIFINLDERPTPLLYQALYYGVFTVSVPLPEPLDKQYYVYTDKSPIEMKSTVTHCLRKKDIRRLVGEKASQFIADNHTYTHRAKEIIRMLQYETGRL